MVKAGSLRNELQLTTSRAGGPGGQNVNKVNTKVTLSFDVRNSTVLTHDQKHAILRVLAPRLTKDGVLIISAQEKRSQVQNKEEVMRKFDKLLTKAFTRRKSRKATKPSKSSVQERLNRKKLHGEKKKWRQKM